MYALQLLGPVTLKQGGQRVNLPTSKLQALLLLLALQGPQHRAHLASWLWPALDDAAARRNLRRELARLRELGAGGLLEAEGERLALVPGTQTDWPASAPRAGDRDGPDGGHAGELAAGLQLDGAELFTEWLDAQRRQLQAQRRDRQQALAREAEDRGDLGAALQQVLTVLQDDPLQEKLHREAMRLYAAQGWREAALQQYARCRELLARELGLVPMPETEALAAALRAESVTTGGSAAADTVRLPADAFAAPLRAGPAQPAPTGELPRELPLAGRQAELDWLRRAAAARVPLLVEGEAGMGKSRLASAFAAELGAYALAQCRSGDAASPYASFTRALKLLAGPALAAAGLPAWVCTELAHVLPEFGPAPPRVAGAEDRSRLHAACLEAWQLLAGDSFDAIVIDDWHWADAASRTLFTLVAQAGQGPLLLLLLRPELDDSGRAELHTLLSQGAQRLVLQPLDASELQALVAQLPGVAPPAAPGTAGTSVQTAAPALALRLWQTTGGNPFFVGETLRHWHAQGGLQRSAAGADDLASSLPGSVREAVLARVARLPQAAQRVLEAAALAAEPFSASLLAGACGLSEVETLQGIEHALAAQLLRELGGGFGFAHDLVPWALGSTLTPDRRRLGHRRLALGSQAAGLAPAEVARHWEAGGEPQRAVEFRLAAAQAALSLAADEVAEQHWQAALADGPSPAQRLRVLEGQASLQRTRDDGAAVLRIIAELERLRDLWQAQPETAAVAQQARLLSSLLLGLLNRSEDALRHADEVLVTLGADSPLRAQALLARSQALNGLRRVDEGADAARTALALGGLDPLREGQLLHSLVYCHFVRGEPAEGLVYARRNLLLWQSVGARRAEVRAHANIGLMHSLLGEQAEAMASMGRALALTRELRMIEPHREFANNLADLHLVLGQPGPALQLAREALALSSNFTQPGIAVFLLGMCVQAHYQRGELGLALQAAEEAQARAAAEGSMAVQMDIASMALDLCTLAGDDARAQALLQPLQGRDTAGVEFYAQKLAFNLVQRALAQGQPAQARTALQPVADIAALKQPRDRQQAALCHAEVLLAEGQAAASLKLLQAWPMAGAHVEVAARAAAVGLQGVLAAPQAGKPQDWVQAVDAALDLPATPVPSLPVLLQARRAAALHAGDLAGAAALARRETQVWQQLADSLRQPDGPWQALADGLLRPARALQA